MRKIPYLIEATVAMNLPRDNLIFVDVSEPSAYQTARIRGAQHLNYRALVAHGSGLPSPNLADNLHAFCNPNKNIIAYDQHANSAAARLLWSMEYLGFDNCAVLNGGLGAWRAAGGAIDAGGIEIPPPPNKKNNLQIKLNPTVLADQKYVLNNLTNPDCILVDTRTPHEYAGLKSASARRGRIPGALNMHWLDTITAHHHRLKPNHELNAMLKSHGISARAEIIVYCQAHRRSAHTFLLLRHLGFKKLRAYAGAWAQWGNDMNLPIEQDGIGIYLKRCLPELFGNRT